MRNQVPILDAEYMHRRATQEAFRHQMNMLDRRMGHLLPAPKDAKEDARDAYLAGEITAEAFEIRLNTAFGLPPYQSVRAA